MAKGFKGRGGGTTLNFKVVGGTEKPLVARENTIWVPTEERITNWVISATEPADGAVWIQTGAYSRTAVNLLKKNMIEIYPVAAYVHADGSYAKVDAEIFQNGSWELLGSGKEYLINNGYIDLTAHPNTHPNSAAAQCNVTYGGKTCLSLPLANGMAVHTFSNVTVPLWATRMVIEYALLGTYDGYDASFTICTVKQDLDVSDAADVLRDGSVTIDVSSVAGQTGDFVVDQCGYADNYNSYFTNAWFE